MFYFVFISFIFFGILSIVSSTEQLMAMYFYEFPDRLAPLGCFLESATNNIKDVNITLLVEATKRSNEDSMRKWLADSSFYHVNLKVIDMLEYFESEGMGDLYKRITSKSPHTKIMLTDVLRVLYVYQNGGMYADLDQVFLEPIDFSQDKSILSESKYFKIMNNNFFKFPKNSTVLKEVIDSFQKSDLKFRESLGPILFEKLFRTKQKNIIRTFEMTKSAFHYSHYCVNNYPIMRKFFTKNIDRACPKFSKQLRKFYSIH